MKQLAFVLLAVVVTISAVARADELTLADLRDFLQDFETNHTSLSRTSALADWSYATDLTDAHAAAASAASGEYGAFMKATLDAAGAYFAALDASRARGDNVPFGCEQVGGGGGGGGDVALDCRWQRLLVLLRRSGGDPKRAEARAQLLATVQEMERIYASGRVCMGGEGDDCLQLDPGLELLMADSGQSYETLLEAWKGWRDAVGPLVRPLYEQFVELSNEGARDYGYASTRELWLDGYDADPSEFLKQLEGLWEQIRPLYEQLHCYVRSKLAEHHGEENVPLDRAIPAHLLGNMWAQAWGNIYPLVAPYPDAQAIDVTDKLAADYNVTGMVRLAEEFYVSLGLDPLPSTFWNNSMLERPPPPREVVCHASAWDLGDDPDAGEQDLRIKACFKLTQEDFFVVSHEAGHLFYDAAYHVQPSLAQGGANDGFHEAIGDTVRLSTQPPHHLVEVGLLDPADAHLSDEAVINYLMGVALDKIAFLPFGFLIDKWRWQVFAGEIEPADYTEAWWKLRRHYQGVRAPVERSDERGDFDPGAKYHVPANTPYLRYFIAHVLQFEFHRALCHEAGFSGPLYNCSIYGSHAAGDKFHAMLELGMSKPWQDALSVVTGQRHMDASAMLEYFEPLKVWLEEQNQGQTCGWKDEDDGDGEGARQGGDKPEASMTAVVIVAVVIVAVGLAYGAYRAHRSKSAFATFEPIGDDEELLTAEWMEMSEHPGRRDGE